MAKISANGDTEQARWRHPDTGAELVLTRKGRLLSKPVKGGSYTLAQRGADMAAAGINAAMRGMERAS